MEELFNKIASIAHDKLLHIDLSAVVTGVAIIIFTLFGPGLESVAYGWAVGFAVGLWKELHDEAKNKSSESGDWGADMIGTTVICVYSLLIMI